MTAGYSLAPSRPDALNPIADPSANAQATWAAGAAEYRGGLS